MNIAEIIMNKRGNIHNNIKSYKKNKNFSCDAKDKNKKKNIKIIGDFELGEKLGEGTFGKVRVASHLITKEKVIFK